MQKTKTTTAPTIQMDSNSKPFRSHYEEFPPHQQKSVTRSRPYRGVWILYWEPIRLYDREFHYHSEWPPCVMNGIPSIRHVEMNSTISRKLNSMWKTMHSSYNSIPSINTFLLLFNSIPIIVSSKWKAILEGVFLMNLLIYKKELPRGSESPFSDHALFSSPINRHRNVVQTPLNLEILQSGSLFLKYSLLSLFLFQ